MNSFLPFGGSRTETGISEARISPAGVTFRIVLGALLLFVVFYIYSHQSGEMGPQSEANLAAASDPSLISALEGYPRAWPPVYPTALWLFHRLGLQVHYFNPICLYFLIVLVWLWARSQLTESLACLAVVLLTFVHTNYLNSFQQVSEALFVLLAFVTMVALSRYREAPTMSAAVLLGVLTAAASLTRFFGVFWIVPVALLQIAMAFPAGSRSARLKNLTTYLSVSFLGIAPWLLLLKVKTGHFFGMDRFSPRQFQEEIAHWNEATDLSTNVVYLLKTMLIDLFSPTRRASHAVVDGPLLASERLIAGVVLLLVTACFVCLVLQRSRRSGTAPEECSGTALASPRAVPLYFATVYLVVLIALWTVGNNDPIYSRFVFPAYVYCILGGFVVFWWFRQQATGFWARSPFYAFYLLLLTVNLVKIGRSFAGL